jgi:hypothetical protein
MASWKVEGGWKPSTFQAGSNKRPQNRHLTLEGGGRGMALSRASQSPEGGGSLLGFERLAEGDLPAIVGDGTWKAAGDTTMPP